MSDGGFDFSKAPERREPKPFEPPPWEREAFEDLKRRRENQVPVAEVPAADEVKVEPPVETPVREVAAPVESEPAAKSGPKTEAAALDEAKVLEMLAGLAGEEPDLRKATRWVAFTAALALGSLGTVLLVWGMAAIVGLRDKGMTGMFGGAILLMFGAGFVGSAVWLVYRTIKRQGVL